MPIDTDRVHDVNFAVSWHARLMIVAWGILAPLAIILARFFKIMPHQEWPKELDNQTWWRGHWIGQSLVVGLSAVALYLVFSGAVFAGSLHRSLGYLVLAGAVVQVVLGIFRGSKGGPTEATRNGSYRGHHYDMTTWRRVFETSHKLIGYSLLVVAIATILLGLWDANAPRWMWFLLAIWWTALFLCFVVMQKKGMAIDTYQAIWGADPSLPGNQRPKPAWGVRRPSDKS